MFGMATTEAVVSVSLPAVVSRCVAVVGSAGRVSPALVRVAMGVMSAGVGTASVAVVRVAVCAVPPGWLMAGLALVISAAELVVGEAGVAFGVDSAVGVVSTRGGVSCAVVFVPAAVDLDTAAVEKG